METTSSGSWRSASLLAAGLLLSALGACDGSGPGGLRCTTGDDCGEPPDARIEIAEAVEDTRSSDTANPRGACLQVVPAEVQFGGRALGSHDVLPVELKNCSSNQLLEIATIDFAGGVERCKGPFCVEIPPALGALQAEAPLVVGAGESITINVSYAPIQEADADANGQPIRDRAVLLVESNADTGTIQVPLSGFGISDDCPVAVIQIEQGDEVIPQTDLYFHGEASYSKAGAITRYEWTVEQPELSHSVFQPANDYADPMFEANAAGTYVFRLYVWDEAGRKSCFSAEAVVFVVPDQALHIELAWEAPGDHDHVDDVGTDLDLHFAHPNAAQEDLDGDGAKDPWFDPSWDVFWFQPGQSWGSTSSTDDDPSLDLDSVDGARPECVNLGAPEPDATYRVGVHYWSDHGFGPADATVRVYVLSQLVYEVKHLSLHDGDLWWVGSVAWPSGLVTPKTSAGGDPWITHDYPRPTLNPR